MNRPARLSELSDFRKFQAMTAQLRREVVKAKRLRVKAVSRHVKQTEARP